ncbi:TetR/AcrR family transcriptional regulator [Desulfosarcina sp.]|uniref:TetR/AcrR family transcriptional regulator n=1 Tax=Desulfosarcina sp. TaxID=2027861 RepID=UPI0029A118EB|nr:TetR/AcrR family transcriptional regulator [Desulfosarcina sp.]MDX2452354.1 TetR/AcrR family transcriptional regulator [Desulfosarcina sp.]MDX2490134.1 TetR/AcrR family transcriptional regulator [Desulfosarcina sp.]
MSKRNAILASATRLFSRNGFQGTAMAELSAITGAATGTIFHHFRNKEDLFLQVLNDVKESILDQFDRHQQTRRDQNGIERVEGVVAFYLQLAGTMEDQFLIIHRHDPYQMAETSPVCRSHLESIYTCLLDIFEEGIQKGMQDGSVAVDSPRQTAMVLFAMVDGIVRLNTYRVYDAGTLYDSLMVACRRLLTGSR